MQGCSKVLLGQRNLLDTFICECQSTDESSTGFHGVTSATRRLKAAQSAACFPVPNIPQVHVSASPELVILVPDPSPCGL